MQEKYDMTEYMREHINKRYFKSAVRKMCQLLARFVMSNRARVALYRLMGMKIGKDVYIGLDCFFDSDYAELITIEDNVSVAFRVIIVAHDGVREIASPITIKEGACVLAGAIVLPGTVVGRKAVVAAGALVATDVPDGATMIGNPGRVVLINKEP